MPDSNLTLADIARIDELRRRTLRQVAHVARTDLAVCLGRLEGAALLAEGEVAHHLERAATAMRSVRTDLELMGQAGAWSVLDPPRAVEVAQTVRRAVAEHATKATDRGAELVGGAGSPNCHVLVDAPHLEWALDTLVEEVVEQARPGDRIRATCASDGDDRVALTVAFEVRSAPDEPGGIVRPENNAALAAVESVVVAAGGILDVSTVDGHGRWVVNVPLGHAAATSAPGSARSGPAAETAEPPHARRVAPQETVATDEPDDLPTPLVMVVEDHPDMRQVLRNMLEPGYQVVMAESAEAALELLDHLIPHVLLCDLTLPGVGGEALIARVRATPAWAGIAIAVVSGRRDPGLRARVLTQGADDYLVKGFSADELRARVANLAAAHFGIEELQDRVDEAQELAKQLQWALDRRVLIEQAKGFLAAELEVPVDEALAGMRNYARSQHLKLRDVADRVVNEGFRPPG